MTGRRKFLQTSLFGSVAMLLDKKTVMAAPRFMKTQPTVVSTWDQGLEANKAAWTVLSSGGRALDAVEQGVKVTEASQNCCVGLGANPDRDGFVTLDACIMDEFSNCGSVAFLERIKHPVSVARRVMEKTPHVMLVGSGAQQFAVAEGFALEDGKLSADAQKNYDEWLKKSEYRPVINIENQPARKGSSNNHGPSPLADLYLPVDNLNHDTIGMIALDAKGNLSGCCTTSGMAFKMRGRVGDSPIIGAGLFVDNAVGACTATGQGEDVIRISGSHTVIELMRQGLSPKKACEKAIERIVLIKKEKAKDIQVAFIALSKNGEVGAFAIQKGFNYAVRTGSAEKLIHSESWFS